MPKMDLTELVCRIRLPSLDELEQAPPAAVSDVLYRRLMNATAALMEGRRTEQRPAPDAEFYAKVQALWREGPIPFTRLWKRIQAAFEAQHQPVPEALRYTTQEQGWPELGWLVHLMDRCGLCRKDVEPWLRSCAGWLTPVGVDHGASGSAFVSPFEAPLSSLEENPSEEPQPTEVARAYLEHLDQALQDLGRADLLLREEDAPAEDLSRV